MASELLQAIEASDPEGALGALKKLDAQGTDPWQTHLSLFPAVQRVINPPFINPHLPKMYRICREFLPYLEPKDLPALLRVEVGEYARRPKRGELPRLRLPDSPVAFEQLEAAFRGQEAEKAAALLAALLARDGGSVLARRLLLLGSGYLDRSLGHSISCTAFILLEALEADGRNLWPAAATLASYFCEGKFHAMPKPEASGAPDSDAALVRQLLRAASGRGIVNLHHTITLYAVERVRPLLRKEEHGHLLGAWVSFLGDKAAEPVALAHSAGEVHQEYPSFFRAFSRLEPEPAAASALALFRSEEGRKRLPRFLIKGVCDLYQGSYDPHYLNGLGSLLWVLERFRSQEAVAATALYQYLDYFFEGLKERR